MRGTLRHSCGTRRFGAKPPESSQLLTCGFSGADDGIRTRDPHLGKDTPRPAASRSVPDRPFALVSTLQREGSGRPSTGQDGRTVTQL